MEGFEVLLPIVISVAFFLLVAFIVGAGVHGRNRRAQLQADVQTRLIDKFGSAPEMVAFLHSDAGRQFMSGVERMPQMMARDRVVSGFRRAIILAFLGVAFLILRVAVGGEGFLIAGMILLALGGAFLVSTWASLRLSRSYGLMTDAAPSTMNIPTSPDPEVSLNR